MLTKKLCTGSDAPVARPGPWQLRIATQHMLQHVPRYRVIALWGPEDDALRAGIDCINQHAPEGDALNEQMFWISSYVRESSGSPIAGWPENKVRNMCINKFGGLAGDPDCRQMTRPVESLVVRVWVAQFRCTVSKIEFNGFSSTNRKGLALQGYCIRNLYTVSAPDNYAAKPCAYSGL